MSIHIKQNKANVATYWKRVHSRVAQEFVELDPADSGVSLEIGELVSQQKSRHGQLFSAAQSQKESYQDKAHEWTRIWAGLIAVTLGIKQPIRNGMLQTQLRAHLYVKRMYLGKNHRQSKVKHKSRIYSVSSEEISNFGNGTFADERQ